MTGRAETTGLIHWRPGQQIPDTAGRYFPVTSQIAADENALQ